MSSNLTHRKQLARALAATSNMTYQQALTHVTRTAKQGLLPARLDEAGMAAALTILAAQPAENLMDGTFLSGGPFESLVYNQQNKQVPPTCDICNRKLGAGEPWWMVKRPDSTTWPDHVGVCCGRHDPEGLPREPAEPTTPAPVDPVDPGRDWNTETSKQRRFPSSKVSNEQIRQAIEINVKTETKIAAWVRSQAGQDPHPVRWDWAPWEKSAQGSRRDSFCDIIIEYSDGKKKMMTPFELELPAAPLAAPDGMQVADLKQNTLVQTPAREVLKVHLVYNEDKVSAEVLYPLQPRTTVRYYTAKQVATWREPSKAMITKYERAWGFDKN